jgi:hypothetical protein
MIRLEPARPRHGELGAPRNRSVHFAHREAAGVTVDLYWRHGEREEAFRVEVVDRCSQTAFTLHPATGKEAIAAYHHPFAAATHRRFRRCDPGHLSLASEE